MLRYRAVFQATIALTLLAVAVAIPTPDTIDEAIAIKRSHNH